MSGDGDGDGRTRMKFLALEAPEHSVKLPNWSYHVYGMPSCNVS